jgi:hypothetical protein
MKCTISLKHELGLEIPFSFSGNFAHFGGKLLREGVHLPRHAGQGRNPVEFRRAGNIFINVLRTCFLIQNFWRQNGAPSKLQTQNTASFVIFWRQNFVQKRA